MYFNQRVHTLSLSLNKMYCVMGAMIEGSGSLYSVSLEKVPAENRDEGP